MTDKQAAKFCQWCQDTLGLSDWSVELCLQDDPPSWTSASDGQVGACGRNRPYKRATIWVSRARCTADGSCPLSTIAHEMMHVAASDTGIEGDDSGSEAYEFLWNKVGDLLAAAYKAKVRLPA